MIVDTSAMVAILRGEPEAEAFASAMIENSGAALSAANYLEAGIVIDGERDPVASSRLDAFIIELGIQVTPVTATQARIARQAYRDFGKGSGHPAKLNYGDCFAYALATERGEPLLFKGEDFVHAGFMKVE